MFFGLVSVSFTFISFLWTLERTSSFQHQTTKFHDCLLKRQYQPSKEFTCSQMIRGDQFYRPKVQLHSSRDVFDRWHSYYNYAHSSYNSPVSLSSSPFWLNEFMENDEENTDISYLPLNVYDLPPATERLLRRITKLYIESDVVKNKEYVKVAEVLKVIDAEYKYFSVPIDIGNETVNFDTKRQKDEKHNDQEEAMHLFSKILSFAALHRLPVHITILLFEELIMTNTNKIENLNIKGANEIRNLLVSFQKGGWGTVNFYNGLSLRVKRDYIFSKRDRYIPWPRKSLFTRSRDAIEAEQALLEAEKVKLPRKLVQKEVMVEEINQIANELNVRSELSLRRSIKDVLTFFPKQNNRAWSRLNRVLGKHATKLRAAGRAGLISYGILNFIWYTFIIMWQWHRLKIDNQNFQVVQVKIHAIRWSLRKFSKALMSAHFGSQVTKMLRMSLAVILAPVGHKALLWTQKKLRVNPDEAVGVISSIILVLTFATWSIIILGDAAFSKSSLGTFAM